MIITRSYVYSDIDGDHWPDTPLGSELYYSLDYLPWASCENDTFVEVEWIVPKGLEGLDSFEEDGQAFIKLKTIKRGSFRVVANLKTKEGSATQIKTVNMILRVY